MDILKELSNYVFAAKYARYDEKLKRRETWEEATSRVEKMHLNKYKNLSDEDKKNIKKAFSLVKEKKVVPSMRALQFGGKAVEAINCRQYNCSVKHIDSIRSFAEAFFVSLCGTGVGYGISKKYLNKLPNLISKKDIEESATFTYCIDDTIEGWADSIEILLMCYFKNTPFSGREVFFDYSKIRRKGAPLKTGGGRAPGAKPLKEAHKKIKKLLQNLVKNKQDKLNSIDAYDILMHCADAVISGGVRRAACSVIFDKDDMLMMRAKTGNWFQENPQRARSNNSYKISRESFTLEEFKKSIEYTKQFGEPGFVFCNDDVIEDILFNPCFEIGFVPVDTLTGETSFQFCNLTSINGAKILSQEDFNLACWAAALIGTLQAGYTQFDYLNKTSQKLTEEEALLGVSITGIMDNPEILLNDNILLSGAEVCKKTNKEWAKKININEAARITAVKPEGTSSLVLMSASGIHPHHSRRYIRRVQANKDETVYEFFKQYNEHATEESVWNSNKTDDVISFPIEVPDNAIIKSDLTAIQHLEIVKKVYQNWVIPGSKIDSNKKNITHNVSVTISVEDHEWDEVVEFLFENKNYFTAVSLISAIGDKTYPQAPNEKIETEEDIKMFNYLKDNWSEIDYTKLQENSDHTKQLEEIACGGGQCDLIST
ncbi:MAG: recombinase [Richelia sp. RM2_1_2]|nr:recombinase [Richelia sp. RM2_1_2]